MDPSALLASAEVIVPAVRALCNQELIDETPNIQFSSLSIDLEMTALHNPVNYVDHTCFHTQFATEIMQMSKIEGLLVQGEELVYMLYTFRSVSKAVPLTLQIPESQVVEILEKEMLKMRDLLDFCSTTITTFYETIQGLASPESRDKVVPEGLHVAMIKLIDILLKLDSLKDMKAGLNNDFTRFKRAIRAAANDLGSRLSSLEALQAELQPFISNGDPRKTKMWIYHTLRAEVKRVIGHEEVLVEVLEQATYSLENHVYTTPDEKFRYMRVIPYLLMLIDGDAEDPKSINVFKGKLFKISTVQKLFREYPVIPLFGDMPITTYFILAKAPHFEHSMGSYWGEVPDAKVVANHQLKTHWQDIKDAYAMFTTRLTTMMHRIHNAPFRKGDAHIIQFSREVYGLIRSGFDRLCDWASVLAQSIAWKYTHPASDEELARLKVIDLNTPGIQYERVLRYNFSEQELSVIVDVVSMIKSLASMMTGISDKVAPFIRFHIHHDMQQMVQGELQPILHRVDKRKNPVLPALLDIRALAADWLNGFEPIDDYRSYSRKQGHVSADFPARVVSAGYTQLSLLRIQVRGIYDEKSSARQKQSFFGRVELEKEDIALLQKFYYESYHYLYMLNYTGVLLSISDLSDLWYREFFLEMTNCVQFPIEMSLPWILTEHVVKKQSSKVPMLENVLYTLDIYNDAAQRALYVVRQQYLYDEIEAEANLVFDQLVFLISDEIYGYYKNCAASGQLEKGYKKMLEAMRGKAYLTTGKRRYEIPMLQRHIQLVGRTIDLNLLIGQHINNYIYRDIDVAIKRFESSDATGIIELERVLSVIRGTHASLSEYLSLDNYSSMLNETNDSTSPASFCGRINFHLLRVIVGDIFPNWSYNSFTQQFVRSPMCIKPVDVDRAPKVDSNMGFGAQCSRVYEVANKLTRTFFGKPHFAAMVSVLKYSDLTFIIQECVQFLEVKIRDLQSFVEALHEGIKPFNLPKYLYRTGGGFGLTEVNLKNLFGYEDLKIGVFQNFKEVGNILGFFMNLSDVLDVTDTFQFICTATLFNLSPGKGRMAADTSNPVCDSLKKFRAAVTQKNDVYGRQKSKSSIDQIPDLCARISSIGSKVSGSKSLIRYVLTRIQDAMFELDIMTEWKARQPPSNGVLNADRSTDFWRLWSALSFLFCLEDYKSVAAETFAHHARVKSELVLHEDQFGHGFYLSGCLFIYLLNQTNSFELLDFSYHLIQMNHYELHKATSLNADAVGRVDDELQKEANCFINVATKMKRIQSGFFSVLRSLHSVPEPMETVVFHAPKFSEEKDVVDTINAKHRGIVAQTHLQNGIVISRSTVLTAAVLGKFDSVPPFQAATIIDMPPAALTPMTNRNYDPCTPSTEPTPPPPSNPPRMSWISPGPAYKSDSTPPRSKTPPRVNEPTPEPPSGGLPPYPISPDMPPPVPAVVPAAAPPPPIPAAVPPPLKPVGAVPPPVPAVVPAAAPPPPIPVTVPPPPKPVGAVPLAVPPVPAMPVGSMPPPVPGPPSGVIPQPNRPMNAAPPPPPAIGVPPPPSGAAPPPPPGAAPPPPPGAAPPPIPKK